MRVRLFASVVVLALAGVVAGQYGDISDLKLARPEDGQHVKSVPPPAGAIRLFDGHDLDAWVARRDGKAKPTWQLKDGGAVQVKGGDMHTRQTFDGRVKLHVEFRVPYLPKNKGQGRGNSGVYLQGRYEVQVLDSYGVKPQMGDCGAIYGVAVPKVNASKAPTVWQSYDIDFTAPVYKDGKKVKPAVMSVIHNGVPIHDRVLIKTDNTTSGMGGDPSKPGPIMLQDHGDPVQYRNIWLLPVQD